jgi:predicted RNA binding protein YcfA (HicA-like mRNA interferase family)
MGAPPESWASQSLIHTSWSPAKRVGGRSGLRADHVRRSSVTSEKQREKFSGCRPQMQISGFSQLEMSGSRHRVGPGGRQLPTALREQAVKIVRARSADFGPTLACEKRLEHQPAATGRLRIRACDHRGRPYAFIATLFSQRQPVTRVLSCYPAPVRVSELLRLLQQDGWHLVATRGSHRQFRHASKPGRITVPGKPSDDLAPGTQNSILKQAGLE